MRRKKPTIVYQFLLVVDMLNNGLTLSDACSRVCVERRELFKFADTNKELMNELKSAIVNSESREFDDEEARRKTREYRKSAGMILRD